MIKKCDETLCNEPAKYNIQDSITVWEVYGEDDYSSAPIEILPGTENLNRHLCFKHYRKWRESKEK